MEEKTNTTLQKQPIKKTSRLMPAILGILGLVVVLSIIGGGALLAGHVWNPSWNPFKPSEGNIIKEKIFKK